MEQVLTFHLAITGQSIPSQLRARRVVGRPSSRIFVVPEPGRRGNAEPVAKPNRPTQPVIRLQPIVNKPLQPFVLRETACDYLECRSSGRRCIVSNKRKVALGYQVAYCLGARHTACPLYARATNPGRVGRARKAAYATAALLMVALIVVAVAQALGPGAPVELGRAVGLS